MGGIRTALHDPARLRAFLLDLPKGGDLHSHLLGAASTELLVSLAAQDMFVPSAPCAHDRLGAPNPSRSCRALLASSPKAALQWRQEAKFTAIEHRYG